MFSRRNLLIRASAVSGCLAFAGIGLFAASDFWNKKDPDTWSDQERETLKTKSPWAKKIHGEGGFGGGRGGGRGSSMDSGGSRGSFGGMSGAESNGMSAGGGGRGGSRGGGGGGGDMGASAPAPQGPEVVIRFESAAPVLAVTKFELPPVLADHYAVSITGLPPQLVVMMLSGRGGRGGGRGRGRDGAQEAAPETEQPPADPAAEAKARQDRLLHAATLSAKNKDPQTADTVMQTADKQTLIFGFAKAGLPIGPTDKDLQFSLKAGPMEFKAKFEPKEMMYKGALTL